MIASLWYRNSREEHVVPCGTARFPRELLDIIIDQTTSTIITITTTTASCSTTSSPGPSCPFPPPPLPPPPPPPPSSPPLSCHTSHRIDHDLNRVTFSNALSRPLCYGP
nr:hypothetical protein CFP56_69858 [Quercus suber]